MKKFGVHKWMIAFDLDGTLAESKCDPSAKMYSLLLKLLEKGYHVAIISGCSEKQMFTQVTAPLFTHAAFMAIDPEKLEKLWLLPCSGSMVMEVDGFTGLPNTRYQETLTLREKAVVWNIFWHVMDSSFTELIGHERVTEWGEIGEDRGSQVTFSMLGQEAPLKEKKKWSKKYGEERYRIAQEMMDRPGWPNELEARVGGTTSIDITRKNRDKAFGISKLLEFAEIFRKEDILFIGDKLQLGGNDYPVFMAGIDCIEVSSPKETEKIIKDILKKTRRQ
jgi:HAD superfamily hydrolase (TIGR01484 family)